MKKQVQKRKLGDVKPDEELVLAEPSVITLKFAIAAFVGGLVAYIVWVLIHKLLQTIGLADAGTSAYYLAQNSGIGDAVAAGIAAGAGGAAGAETYKWERDPILGIHSNPPNGDDGRGIHSNPPNGDDDG